MAIGDLGYLAANTVGTGVNDVMDCLFEKDAANKTSSRSDQYSAAARATFSALTYIGNVVDESKNNAGNRITSDFIVNLTPVKIWLTTQSLTEPLAMCFLALTFPYFLYYVAYHLQGKDVEKDKADIDYKFYRSIFHHIEQRKATADQNLQEKFEFWAVTMWTMGVVIEVTDLMDDFARKFIAHFAIDNARTMIQRTTAKAAFEAVYVEMKSSIMMKCFDSIKPATAQVMYTNTLSRILDTYETYRLAEGSYKLSFAKKNDRDPRLKDKVNVEYEDQSIVQFVQTVDNHGFLGCFFKLNPDGTLTKNTDMVSLSEISFRLSLSKSDETLRTTISIPKCLEYALEPTKYIPINNVDGFISGGNLTIPSSLTNAMINVPINTRTEIYTGTISSGNLTGSSLTEVMSKLQSTELRNALTAKFMGDEYSAANTVMSDWLFIFFLRTLALLFPKSTETGNVPIQYKNPFGMPKMWFEEVPKDNIFLDISHLEKFIKYVICMDPLLGLLDQEITLIGSLALTKILQQFSELGFEPLKSEIIPWYAELNDAKIVSTTLHMERASNVSVRNKDKPFSRVVNNTVAANAMRWYLESVARMNNILVAVLHALAIGLSYDTKDIPKISTTIQRLDS